MSHKPKLPKVRHVWGINPRTRVTPNKKHEPLLCTICRGEGRVYMPSEADCRYEDCISCGGTGYVN